MDQTGQNNALSLRRQLKNWQNFREAQTVILATVITLLLSFPAAVAEETDPLPKPRDIELTTKDGVRLNVVYYEGTEGEATVPVIVLHDWQEKEEGSTYETLAEYLQDNGYAVLLPDLRGHGSSTTQKLKGRSRTLEPNKVRPENVVAGDMEAIRMFLLKENNANKLNIAATTLIGVGKGAILAAGYAIYDWDDFARVPRNNPGKQRLVRVQRGGQKDVKALVLISPETKIGKTMKIDALARHPEVGSSEVSTLILVGQKQVNGKDKKPKATRESKTAETVFAKLKKNGHNIDSDDVGKRSLFLNVIDTELNGEKLVNETNLDLKARQTVRAFLNLRVRDRNFEWKERDYKK